MVIGFVYISCGFFLKRKHTFIVHVAGAGDQVLFIGIFRSKAVGDEVAAVIQIVAVHDTGVFDCVPAGWPDLTDFPARFGRHGVFAHIGIGHTASSELVEFMVGFKSVGVLLFPAGEIWFISMYSHRRFSIVFWNFFDGKTVFFWAACAVVISAAESELVSEMGGTGTKATEKASKTASKEVLHLVKCNRFMGFPPYSVMNCFL